MEKLKCSKNWGLKLLLAGIFLLMLALNYMVPLFNDDYFYVLNLNTEKVISGFPDVLDSISNFRNGHNGRVAAHFFAQLFLWLPRGFFILANSLMYTLLVYMIYRFAKTDSEQKNTLLLFAAAAMIWLLMPAFGHGFLWLTGSCSYLWAITFLVLYLYPFFSRFMGKAEKSGLLINVPALAYAFFAGSYSENGSFSALAVSFCFLFLMFVREKKLPAWLLLRFFAACAGFLYLMLAPSELGKKDAGSEGFSLPLLESMGIQGPMLAYVAAALLLLAAVMLWGIIRHRKVFCRIAALICAAVLAVLTIIIAVKEAAKAQGLLDGVNLIVSDVSLSVLLIFGIYFVLLMWALSLEADVRKILAALVFGVGAVASLVVFLVAIYFPARGACVATVYTVIADLLLLTAICEKQGEKNLRIFAAVLTALFIPALVAGVADVGQVHHQYQQRKLIIDKAQAENAESLLLPPIVSAGKFGVSWQGEAADYYYGMQEFYGIDSIIIEGAEEF